MWKVKADVGGGLDSSIAPSLQAAQAELARAQLEVGRVMGLGAVADEVG